MKQRILNTKIINHIILKMTTRLNLWCFFFYIKQFGVYVEKVTIAIANINVLVNQPL